MVDVNSITLFQFFSLSVKDFGWVNLAEENVDKLQYFLERRQKTKQQLIIPPYYAHSRKIKPAYLAGRWVLEENDPKNLIAWAELQLFMKTFSTSMLFISGMDNDKNWAMWQEALSLLISGIFIVYQTDILRLIPTDPNIFDRFKNLEFGKILNIHTFLKGNILRPKDNDIIKEYPVIDININSWWTLPQAIKDRKTLSYLEKRVKESKGPPRFSKKKKKFRLFH